MKELTSLERVRAVLTGKTPDYIPVVPQGFLFSAKTAGYEIGEINRNPAKMAESHRICQERYQYDGCVVDVDDATLAEACGAKVVFRERDVASVDEHVPVLKNLSEIDYLNLPDPEKDGRICEWLETVERLSDSIGDHVFIMGRADQGPFSLLCLLRGTQEFMMDLLTEEEEVIQHALEWTTEAHIRFAKAQIQAGAHATSMGDAYASPNLISSAMYRTFAFPYEKKAAETMRAAGMPYSVHICGDTRAIISDMGKTGAKILEIDWQTDMGDARAAVPDDVVLMGNINPSDPMCIGTPQEVQTQVEHIIKRTKGAGIILSSGCALGANTRPENMAELIDAARKYGKCE